MNNPSLSGKIRMKQAKVLSFLIIIPIALLVLNTNLSAYSHFSADNDSLQLAFTTRMTSKRAESTNTVYTSQTQASLARNEMILVTGTLLAVNVTTYQAHIKPWWSGKKSGFHFRFDWYSNYWREMDKFGHFYCNMQLTRLTAWAFRWAGVSRNSALWLGFANSMLLYTSVELTDAGFSEWGFSVPDYVMNLLGASYPLLQEYLPEFQHFNFKISYWPSQYLGNEEAGKQPGFIIYEPYQYPTGDYDGMTFWLSADVSWMLPSTLKPYWPEWLNLAVGYGAKNLPQANPAFKYREFYLALDYNINRLLPAEGGFVGVLKSVLNAVHLPAPAIRFSRVRGPEFLIKF
jgi:hypothetical protein